MDFIEFIASNESVAGVGETTKRVVAVRHIVEILDHGQGGSTVTLVAGIKFTTPEAYADVIRRLEDLDCEVSQIEADDC